MSYPASLQKLIDLFTKFPGIGPRQAARLAFFITKDENSLAESLASALIQVKEKTVICKNCFRTMEKNLKDLLVCSTCLSPGRNKTIITIIEKEADLINLEKSGSYNGLYHLLGGVISPLDSDSPRKLKLREMFDRIKDILEGQGQAEIILATNPTTEGDTTALYIERVLLPLKNKYPRLVISRLARGLSLGSELEYADETTIKSALDNRTQRT
ncbi:MAG: recombination mediator RecR [bacterium]|nr:recombination mediator RecR [bacterium]